MLFFLKLCWYIILYALISRRLLNIFQNSLNNLLCCENNCIGCTWYHCKCVHYCAYNLATDQDLRLFELWPLYGHPLVSFPCSPGHSLRSKRRYICVLSQHLLAVKLFWCNTSYMHMHLIILFLQLFWSENCFNQDIFNFLKSLMK